MKQRLLALFLMAAMVLSLAACGKKEEAPEEPVDPPPVEEPEPAPEPEPEPEPEPQLPEHMNPLTGMEIAPEKINNRPVAVMFNNLKVAQPQLGVSQADIIYEIPAEGGITRMLGLFQSLDGVGNLGSIRSTRPYYVEIAEGHNALLVHAGASPEAYKNIASWDVDNMDGVNGGSDAKIFWRDANRRSSMGYEHSLLTSGEKVQEYLDKGYFPLTQSEGYSYPQTFSMDNTIVDGAAATAVKLAYTGYKTGLFDYDEATGKYRISQYGSAYKDGNTGEQVSATNVLVLETAINVIAGDSEGRLKVQTTGSGKGTYFCGGKAVAIQWSRTDRNSPFVYTLTDGSPLVLQQGNSYICIMDPGDSTLSYQ